MLNDLLFFASYWHFIFIIGTQSDGDLTKMIRVKMVSDQRNQGPSTHSLPFLTCNFPLLIFLFVCLKCFPQWSFHSRSARNKVPSFSFTQKYPVPLPQDMTTVWCSLGIRDHNSFLGVMAAACSPVEEKLNLGSFMLLLLPFLSKHCLSCSLQGISFFFLCVSEVDCGASWGGFVWLCMCVNLLSFLIL